MSLETVLSLIVSALLLVYLAYALLRPEKFEMTFNGWLQILFFLALILAVTKPMGVFMTHVFNRERTFLDPLLKPIERLIYKLTRVNAEREMRWTEYAVA